MIAGRIVDAGIPMCATGEGPDESDKLHSDRRLLNAGDPNRVTHAVHKLHCQAIQPDSECTATAL